MMYFEGYLIVLTGEVLSSLLHYIRDSSAFKLLQVLLLTLSH